VPIPADAQAISDTRSAVETGLGDSNTVAKSLPIHNDPLLEEEEVADNGEIDTLENWGEIRNHPSDGESVSARIA
jgi:hypothetical protein